VFVSPGVNHKKNNTWLNHKVAARPARNIC
jgi:hypothetical protein